MKFKFHVICTITTSVCIQSAIDTGNWSKLLYGQKAST